MKVFCLALFLLPALAWGSMESLDSQIRAAAHRYRLDPNLVKAIVETESGHLGTAAISPKGARGLMQVMPRTADEVGIANPHHALSNLMGACQYLRMLLNRYQFDLTKTLAAYNAGPARVDQYKGVPPFRETRLYVRKVLSAYKRFQEQP